MLKNSQILYIVSSCYCVFSKVLYISYVPSLRYIRGLGWRMHCCVEVTESSTNKQHHLSANALLHGGPGVRGGQERPQRVCQHFVLPANGWAAGIPGRRGPERVCPEPPRHQSQTVPLIRTRWRRFQDPCPGCSFRPPPDRSRAKTAANGWAAGIPGRRGPDTAVSSTAGQAPVAQAFSSLSFWASTLLAFASRKLSCAWVVASSAPASTIKKPACEGGSLSRMHLASCRVAHT